MKYYYQWLYRVHKNDQQADEGQRQDVSESNSKAIQTIDDQQNPHKEQNQAQILNQQPVKKEQAESSQSSLTPITPTVEPLPENPFWQNLGGEEEWEKFIQQTTKQKKSQSIYPEPTLLKWLFLPPPA